MFDKFVPDIYTKSIYTIDYKALKKNNDFLYVILVLVVIVFIIITLSNK